MPGLDTLLPEYQEQYNALMPEIERKVRGDLTRRGMTNSGDATDALARAQAQLLAELAGKSANTRADQAEAERQRRFAGEQNNANRSEAARAQRLGLIGSAVGGLGTLAGMYAMRPQVQPNITAIGDRGFTYDPRSRSMRAIPVEGAEGGITPAGGGVMADGQSPTAAPGGPASIWKKAKGFGGLAAGGAAGGLLGSQLSSLIAGRDTGTMGDVGAGLGGLGGAAALSRYGPWGAGLGALLGAGGGGLLGNLFR